MTVLRRDFLRFLGLTAASAALPALVAPERIEDVVDRANATGKDLWLSFVGSDGEMARGRAVLPGEDHVAVLPEGTTLRVESWTENAHGIARVEWPSRVHYVGDDLTPEQEAELDLWLEART